MAQIKFVTQEKEVPVENIVLKEEIIQVPVEKIVEKEKVVVVVVGGVGVVRVPVVGVDSVF